jgi:hypothetical protein
MSNNYADINEPGENYFLKADIPVALVSKFSKTLMFRFKSLPDFHATVNFSFSTYEGEPSIQYGFMIIILSNFIQAQFYGTNNPDGTTNTLHSVFHAIAGGKPVFFDDFVHMTVILDHTNNFITSNIIYLHAAHEVEGGQVHERVIHVQCTCMRHKLDGVCLKIPIFEELRRRHPV